MSQSGGVGRSRASQALWRRMAQVPFSGLLTFSSSIILGRPILLRCLLRGLQKEELVQSEHPVR
jgi:hypothetical protein